MHEQNLGYRVSERFPFAVAGLSIMGTISAVALSVAPWRIPLRTALVWRRLDTFRWLRWRSLPFRVRKGCGVATERCVPIMDSPAVLLYELPYTLSFAVTSKNEPFVLSVCTLCITLQRKTQKETEIYATAGLDYSINYYHSGEPVWESLTHIYELRQ